MVRGVLPVLSRRRSSRRDGFGRGVVVQQAFFEAGEKMAETLNQMGFDAMTIGNHEFDGGHEELGDFLKNLTFPIVGPNIVSDNEKLNSTIKPYHIFEDYELAVIGVTTETIPSISNPGEGTTFTDAIAADMRLAQETSGLQLIMGGHSHTLLGDMEDARGPYPTIEMNTDGDEVFVVTAYRWAEHLGYIDVTYDSAGKILAYRCAPIHITNTTEQDEGLEAQVGERRILFEEFAAVFGNKDRLVSEVNHFNNDPITSFFQVSTGIKVEYNPNNEVGERLVRLTVGGSEVDMEKVYTVVTIDFLSGGGDNIFVARDNMVILDTIDEVFVNYIEKISDSGDNATATRDADGWFAGCYGDA
ncbi:Uu.00g133200.m01.CDS01 [Anthostomella pinea]|uniref:Uu.00g133200.m01.CDS01 n=1 Tax=Anthostomella pinea TaxID=933095 RepID=A0AAI8VME1_9PEZI|nr:Uu.00g133200.m01.CDS01 [Anthostomella pinea]